jgi:hypothetical protein
MRLSSPSISVYVVVIDNPIRTDEIWFNFARLLDYVPGLAVLAILISNLF